MSSVSTIRPIANGSASLAFDVMSYRRDFPALDQEIAGQPLAYLDNAASAMKPRAMLEAVTGVYERDYSNVHRGVHTLSQRATASYEGARDTARDFLGADQSAEIVFVRGSTEGINLVARSFVQPRLEPNDEIVISEMEHHSNIVPWQLIAEETGARLRILPIDDRGDLRIDLFEDLLTERTKFIALVHVSNALGTINPVADLLHIARDHGIPTLLDGAQAAPHIPIDVTDLGCDFYTISGHKLFGPTGIGVLYGKHSHLQSMRPYQGGGEMITRVTFDSTEFNVPPHKFEAGTPNIAGAVGLGASMRYLRSVGFDAIASYEAKLLEYGTAKLEEIPGLRLIGTARHKAALLTFVLEDVHAHDVGTVLDSEGIAVRSGHHCAQPVVDHFGLAATSRASLVFYNTFEEIDRLAAGLHKVRSIFSR